jgi:hypothetical protein
MHTAAPAQTAPYLSSQSTQFGAAFFGGPTARSRPVNLTDSLSKILQKDNREQIAASKLAMLEMLRDRRFENLLETPGNLNAFNDMRRSLQGNLGEAETAQAFSAFGTMFRGVEGAGDVFMRHVKEYRSILQQRERSLIGQGVSRKNARIDPENPIAAFSSFGRPGVTLRQNPNFVQTMTEGMLTENQRNAYRSFFAGLEQRGVSNKDIQYNTQRDLVRINQRIDGRDYQFNYLQARIGNESHMIPLDDASSYMVEGVGSIYHRDRAGSAVYSASGRVLHYPDRTSAPTLTGGMDFLFGKTGTGEFRDTAHILDVMAEGYKSGKSLDQLLFSMDGSPVEGAIRLLEFVNQSSNPMLSMARKNAQVQVIDPTRPAQMSAATAFGQYREDMERMGQTLLPVSSPGQIASDKYYYSPIDPQSPDEVPGFIRLTGLEQSEGQFLTQSDLTKRPVRFATEPFTVINPGSSRALDSIGAMQDMHIFSQGAFGEMDRFNMGAFVRGTWYHNKRGKANFSKAVPLKNMDDSAGFTLDVRLPSGLKGSDIASMSREQMEDLSASLGRGVRDREMGTFESKPGIFEISKGRNRQLPTGGSEFIPYEYNQKLDDAIAALEGHQAGGVLDTEARQNLIRGLGINFEQDEFIGFNNVLENIQKQKASVEGQAGPIKLIDLLQTEGGYKAVLAREASLAEGAKIEGSTLSTISRNVMTSSDQGPIARRREAALATRLSQMKDDDPRLAAFYNPSTPQVNPNGTPSRTSWSSLTDAQRIEAFRGAQRTNKKSNYGNRLFYADVGHVDPSTGKPFDINSPYASPNTQKYIDALNSANPELIEKNLSEIRGKYNEAAKKIGINSSKFGQSETWALWDIGKQLYHYGTGGVETDSAKYRVANPLSDDEMQSEIIARHLGWEDWLGKEGSQPGASQLPSHEYTKRGKELMAQAGVTLSKMDPALAKKGEQYSLASTQLSLFPTEADALSGVVGEIETESLRDALTGLVEEKNQFLGQMSGIDLSALSDRIDFVAENKRLGATNVKELRTQQQTALSTFSQLFGQNRSLADINNYDLSGVDTATFLSSVRSSFGSDVASYTENDSLALAKYLLVAQE